MAKRLLLSRGFRILEAIPTGSDHRAADALDATIPGNGES